MSGKKDNDNVIDVGKLVKTIWSRRKLFLFRVWPITFVLACLYIVCIPRYYTSDSKLAPELSNSMDVGGLGSLASSFGFDLGSMQSADAISPMLYPDLMEDNGFVTSLFTIRVKSADGEIDTDYYTYLRRYQKQPWWGSVTKTISKGIKSLLPSKPPITPGNGDGGVKSPYWLSEDDNNVVETIRGNIHLSIDKQTGIININTKAQDPLVAKILADSVQTRLQELITDYRTNKARIDVEHYEELAQKTLKDYEETCKRYALFAEANTNIVMTSYQTKVENLQKEMQLKYTTYTTIAGQLEAAKAKLQERTPAFTVIKGACVITKPAGPKRMIFVLGMLILLTAVYMFWVVRKDLREMLLPD